MPATARAAEAAGARRAASATARRSAGTGPGPAWSAGTRCRRLARKKAFALRLLARQLARAPHGLGLLAHALFGGLLVVVAQLHLAEDALALHLLLERLEGLIDVVIANLD
jgi:hypothetical protein